MSDTELWTNKEVGWLMGIFVVFALAVGGSAGCDFGRAQAATKACQSLHYTNGKYNEDTGKLICYNAVTPTEVIIGDK